MNKIIKNLIFILILLFGIQSISFSYEFNTTLSKNETIYKTSTAKINAINPGVYDVAGNSFPGYRGANQLIIYTSDFGRKTGTNEFGTEAIVVNGYVTSLSGADSLIPVNGFVISGHGRAKEWINNNVSIGSKIIVDVSSKTITSVLTPDSYIFEAEAKIKEVYEIMKFYAYKNILYDYTNSAEYLKKSQKALLQAAKQKETSQKYASIAIENADRAIEYSIPYYEQELKGVWIRPTEKNSSEISNTLDKLKEAGINTVFLETYYHAKTIYQSDVLTKYQITNQRQEFVGFDPLMIWITEAHKRGMKLIVWFECFYVGNDKPEINPNHILSVYPNWANTTKEKYASGKLTSSLTEHNGYFLDPANPDVQNFLIEVLAEIITKYEPDGINLDYIRYPQTVEKKSSQYENASWGYSQYAREEFKSIYEIDPVDIHKNTPEWELWAMYRQDKVSDFVRKAGNLVRTRGTNAKLTAVIFPDRQRSLDTKMQDWRTWSIRGYVDGFTPLLLSCDYDTAKSLLSDIKNNSSFGTNIYAGIFVSFMNGTTDDMLRQIHMSRELNSSGVIIFESSHFTKKYKDAVSKSAFTPLTDRAVNKILSNEISQKKLQQYLDKAIKDFCMEEVIVNQIMNKKQQKYQNSSKIVSVPDQNIELDEKRINKSSTDKKMKKEKKEKKEKKKRRRCKKSEELDSND